MAKLTWDATGERFYETGDKYGVLYVMGDDSYGTGVAWNGLTAVTESPSGAEETALYADNIKYASLRSAEEYSCTIECYMYPEEFAACNGEATPSAGVHIGQQGRKTFGFCFRSEIGNDTNNEAGYKLHLIYGLTASPSEKSYATINDSPDAITFSYECTSTPVEISSYKPVSTITIDSTKADATKLAALEAILYGDDTNQPKLPLPQEVITTMSASVSG